MSDANVVGRWVTDAGDARIGDGYTCWRLHGPSCGIGLSAPFYEPLGPRHPTETLCPACALAHFGVRPPGTETTECGHAADDPACTHWGVWMVAEGVREGGTFAVDNFDDLRAGAPILRCNRKRAGECAAVGNGATLKVYDYEPRLHSAAATRPATETPPTETPPIEKRHGIYGGASTAPTLRPCSLDWCSAPTHSTFCSPNCERAHEDRITAVARREAFVARLRHANPGGLAGQVGLASERAWAEAKTAEEIETIRRAWSALRHEAATGNEDAFASTGDEP